MSLVEQIVTDDGIVTRDKVQVAIERLRAFDPMNAGREPYFLAFSGGKDSQVIYHLAILAHVTFDAHYHVTTIDPPELVQFIKRQYPIVKFDLPQISMWRLIEKKRMLPLRMSRYCCSELKEGGGRGRTVITGVRWAESANRKRKRNGVELNSFSAREQKFFFDNDDAEQMFRTCPTKGKHVINPIIDWTDEDVWEFHERYGLPHCCLYDEGFKRMGCIGCPCATERERRAQFDRWPAYRAAYLRAIERVRLNVGWAIGDTAEEVMEWWLTEPARSDAPLDGQEKVDGY